MLYIIRRNDGFMFMQRYVPRDYNTADGAVTYERIATFQATVSAVNFMAGYYSYIHDKQY